MPADLRDDADDLIDPSVQCSDCEAVCCRLIVFVEPEDLVPRPAGANPNERVVMNRGGDGWCVALDRTSMRCSIYELRPDACRRFTMGAGYCRFIRKDYRRRAARIIPHVLVNTGS